MNKIPYTKPFLSLNDQLVQLKNRGLIVENDEKALHLLEVVSYYRLSGYWYPLLLDKPKHIFKPSATFDTAFKIYCFDRELRKMILAELEKIEVAIRAKATYVLSETYGPFWFEDSNLFKNPVTFARSLVSIASEYERSDAEFVSAFKNKYTNPLPASWMIMEITSFGSLSMIYKNLKSSKEKREIAHYFGLADTVFQTWLHSIVYLRNVCAHHSRLWNRNMSIQPEIPKTPHKQWLKNTSISNKRTYFILCMINYLLQTVNPKNTFKGRFGDMLSSYANIDVKAMGFPTDWDQEPLWKI